jgi:hypothetical protein
MGRLLSTTFASIDTAKTFIFYTNFIYTFILLSRISSIIFSISIKNPDVIIIGYITVNKIVLLSRHLGREIYIYFYLNKPKDGIIFCYYIYSYY